MELHGPTLTLRYATPDDAHALLVEMLAESPSVVDDVLDRREGPAQFAPALDLAAMCQQYVHSRLFTS